MNKEEIDEAVANGKYIANIYGEGSIGYYKVYSMIDVISELQKENEELKTINLMQKYRIEVIDERELISKKEIREFIKKELPDDEIMECCSICDVNGIEIRKGLEKILENKEIN